MTNEIKEILDKLEIVARKHTIEVCEDGSKIETMSASVVDELRLNNYSAKILLDCITNLQEENKGWEMIFDTFSRRPYAHRYLEEKRKELNNDKIVGLDSESIYKDYYNLKQRIDKAVEYIKSYKNEYAPYELSDYNIREILNILRGDE